jgi:hypothetical protein
MEFCVNDRLRQFKSRIYAIGIGATSVGGSLFLYICFVLFLNKNLIKYIDFLMSTSQW